MPGAGPGDMVPGNSEAFWALPLGWGSQAT